MTTEAPKPLINLRRREAKVTNLNFQPEKAGENLVERVDLSLEILLETNELGALIRTRGNVIDALWDKKGDPQFRDLGKMELDFVAAGALDLGLTGKDKLIRFEPAKLKKIGLRPEIGRKASVRLQVRMDPGGHLEQLGRMRIEERAIFVFLGHADVDENAENENDKQGSLGV